MLTRASDFHSRHPCAPPTRGEQLTEARAILADFRDQTPGRLAWACRTLLSSRDPKERDDVRELLKRLSEENPNEGHA